MGKKSSSSNTPKPTAQERALAKRSEKQHKLYKRLYRPLHKDYLERTAATPAKRARARGIVNADIQQARRSADQDAIIAAGQAGNRLGSNKTTAIRGLGAQLGAAVGANAAARATQGVDTQDLQGRINFTKVGLGVAGDSLRSQTQLAQNATSAAVSDAYADYEKSQSLAHGLGTAAGAYAGWKGVPSGDTPTPTPGPALMPTGGGLYGGYSPYGSYSSGFYSGNPYQ